MTRGRRFAIIGLALAAAALLALAVQGGRWWEVGDVTIGPVSSHRCFDGDCRVVGLGWVGGGSGWARAGQATYTAALLAAALLVFSAAGLAARRVIRVVAKSGVVAAITAAIAGGVFVATFPGLADMAIGRGVWCFLAGVVLAVAAQLLVLKPSADPPTKPA